MSVFTRFILLQLTFENTAKTYKITEKTANLKEIFNFTVKYCYFKVHFWWPSCQKMFIFIDFFSVSSESFLLSISISNIHLWHTLRRQLWCKASLLSSHAACFRKTPTTGWIQHAPEKNYNTHKYTPWATKYSIKGTSPFILSMSAGQILPKEILERQILFLTDSDYRWKKSTEHKAVHLEKQNLSIFLKVKLAIHSFKRTKVFHLVWINKYCYLIPFTSQ